MTRSSPNRGRERQAGGLAGSDEKTRFMAKRRRFGKFPLNSIRICVAMIVAEEKA
jgi:hypothetical protein